MAEYILKLDIDESALARKLKKILGGMNMGGGGMATVFGGGGGAGVTGKQSQKMFELMVKNMEKQTEMLQKKLDKADATRKGGFIGKFGPGLMKIAGFAGIITGLLQFRKMLIDSSPILQAVLKIMSTAFNLVLRPFGDFLGFFLMPLAIGLLSFAIPFYAKLLPLYPAFLEAGTKFFAGDVIGALNDIKSALGPKATTDDCGNPILEMPVSLFGDQISQYFDEVAVKFRQSLLMLEGKWNVFWLITVPESWDRLLVILGEAWEVIAPILNKHIVQPFLMFVGRWNVFWLITVPETLKQIGGALNELGAWFQTHVIDPIKNFWTSLVQSILGILGISGGGGGGGSTGGQAEAHANRNQGAIEYSQKGQGQCTAACQPKQGMAGGGIINEPIFGVGRSGKRYSFGESGPETVTPGVNVGGSIIVNVYGYSNMGEFERQVKPLMMRWLKESKANRGIL